MLSNRFRTFQQIYSNRLQHHPFLSIVDKYDQNQSFTQSNVIYACYRSQHIRCDVMTQKDQTQAQTHRLNANDPNSQLQSSSSSLNQSEIASRKLLPFASIPCADDQQSQQNICGRFFIMANQLKQLLTAQWDNRFHEEIDECHRRYGPIFRKTLAQNQVVFVKSPDLIRDVFFYEGKYPKHPLPEAWVYYNQLHKCQRGLFFMNDAEWMETRKNLAPLMLRNEQRFFTAIEYATDDLIRDWKQNAGKHCGWNEVPQALTSLYGWSVRVLMGIIFGNATARMMCIELRETIDHFAEIVQKVFEDTVPFSSISPELARNMRLPIWKNFETSVTDTLKIADEIIAYGLNKHQQQRQQQSKQKHTQCDDGLLAEMDCLNMTTEMIRRIFIDLIIAAGDTTAFSTQWALYLLAKNPKYQEIIRNELIGAAAAASSSTSINKYDTPLIRGTVREALRLFPVATLIGRIFEKDAILGNYHINKYTLVLISMYSAGRDETSFPNANQFEPSRWNRDPITGTLKFVNRAQSSIPYAMGARNCIGQRIANAQMHIILSKLLRTFHIELLNANDIDIVMRLIIMPSVPMRFAVKCID